MSGTWTDISGLIDFQKVFITDISNNAIDVSDARNQISSINANLVALQSNLVASGASLLPTLTFQTDISYILHRETDRLVQKKTNIDAAYAGQKRMIALNDSMAAKKKAYNYMLLIVVLVLFAYMGLIKLKEFVPVEAGSVIDLLIIALFIGGFIYCFKLFLDISRRNNMDFNRIDLAEPNKKSDKEIQDEKDKARKEGKLTTFTESGKDKNKQTTCPDGAVFNTQYQICLPNVPLTNTNIYSTKPGSTPETKAAYSSFTTDKDNVKIFKSDGDGFYWGDAVAICGNLTNYDTLMLKCKTEGFCGGNRASSSSSEGAKPYSPSEWGLYGQYKIGA